MPPLTPSDLARFTAEHMSDELKDRTEAVVQKIQEWNA
jgi:hypothetical protein